VHIDKPDTFWSKVNKTDTCWLWTAGKSNGYGRYRSGGFVHLAHRYAYIQAHGNLDSSTPLDHLCRVSACVNPSHLEPVTHAENIRRGIWGQGRPPALFCKRGHEFTQANSFFRRDGRGKQCRACIRARERPKYVVHIAFPVLKS
jgi:hypothetical protein